MEVVWKTIYILLRMVPKMNSNIAILLFTIALFQHSIYYSILILCQSFFSVIPKKFFIAEVWWISWHKQWNFLFLFITEVYLEDVWLKKSAKCFLCLCQNIHTTPQQCKTSTVVHHLYTKKKKKKLYKAQPLQS